MSVAEMDFLRISVLAGLLTIQYIIRPYV